jgi:hypothetical protein
MLIAARNLRVEREQEQSLAQQKLEQKNQVHLVLILRVTRKSTCPISLLASPTSYSGLPTYTPRNFQKK